MRNFDYRDAVKLAFIAAALFTLLEPGVTFAQAKRIALSPQQRTASTAIPRTNPPAVQPAPVAPPNDQLQELLDRAIEITSKRYLTANSHSPWQIFHCILAMRQDCVVRLGQEKVNAIQWISTAEPQFDKQPWLLLTPHGAKFHPYTQKYYFEGHPGQFLALLSQSNLPMDHEFHVQGKVVKLSNLINNTMKEVNTNEEVTWVLWALQHYLKPDAVWVNQANETWSIERLVQMETSFPVVGAPCGGNHRLFALTRARDKYLQSGGRLRGVWLQADQKIKEHIKIAQSLQNSDGSFSSESYKGQGHTSDVNARFNTTGHTMEFLAISLPQERLSEPWVRSAVWMLSRELIIHQNTQIDCGPLFHTLDALILYRDRIRPKLAPLPIESPAADPQVAESKLDVPLSALLKSTPEPMKAAESSAAIPQSKTADTAPPETSSPESVNQPTPIPIPDPVTAPETKSVDSLEQSAPAEPQTRLLERGSSRSRVVASKPLAPKVDPTQLGDVGNPAPAPRFVERHPSPPRMAHRDRIPSLAPQLLPDSELPIRGLDPSPRAVDSAADKPAWVRRVLEGTVNQVTSDLDVSVEEDLPVSALEPSNS